MIMFQIIFLYLSRISRHLEKNTKLEHREWQSYFSASLFSLHVSPYLFLGIEWTAQIVLPSPKMAKTNSVCD